LSINFGRIPFGSKVVSFGRKSIKLVHVIVVGRHAEDEQRANK
jgi:hypothetical protein